MREIIGILIHNEENQQLQSCWMITLSCFYIKDPARKI